MEHHFCSKQCSDKYKVKDKIIFNCEMCNKEVYIDESQYKKNNHHFCSKSCSQKYHKKENHPMWDSTISEQERLIKRYYFDYKEWRKIIWKRDDYSCKYCGKRGGKLIAHHLDGYNWCIEKRTDVNNGITLCLICHKKFHSIYGYGNNTLEQYLEFEENKLKELELSNQDSSFLSAQNKL